MCTLVTNRQHYLLFQNPFQPKKILIEKGCMILKFVGASWGLGLIIGALGAWEITVSTPM